MVESEKKINELEKKINELKGLSLNESIDLDEEIRSLNEKLIKMKQRAYAELSPWEKVELARHKERPTALDYINIVFDEFIEFHGDRAFKDDPSIVGGIGRLNDKVVTVIGQQKGRDTKENITRNFGMPHPEGYRKALRLMKQAEKFNRPIICLIDTPGAFCGISAEERSQGESIARNLIEMSGLETPIISIVIGEGGSGGALALGIADQVWMLEHAVYSILSPEGFASILWKDSKRSKEAADKMGLTAHDLKKANIIDKVIEEPLGGAHKDAKAMAKILKNQLIRSLQSLTHTPIETLLDKRYMKYRNMGTIIEKSTDEQKAL